MEFGNFKTFFLSIGFAWFIGNPTQAQTQHKTSDFLYNQLDYFLQNPTSSSALRLDKLIDSKKQKLHTKTDQLAWVITHANLGFYLNKFGNLPAAIHHYEISWKTYSDNTLSNYDIIENCLKPLGNLYIKIGDLEKADSTIKSYLYLAEQNQNKSKVVSGITNLSIVYNNKKQYQKAIQLLYKGLEIDSNNPNLLTNLATNQLALKNYNQAQELAQQIITIATNQINAYQILAAIALEKKDIELAKKYINKAKNRLLENKNTSTRDLAKWQLAYIDILLSKSEFTEIQKVLTEIYTTLLPEYTETSKLPLEKNLIADRVLLKALDIQSYIYERTGQSIKAIQSYDLAFVVNTKLDLLYPLQETRILQHSQNRNRTESYIDLLFLLHHKTNNEKYIEKAFLAAEQSKAPFVNEALVSKKILSRYKNDSLVLEKKQLTQEIATQETLILREKLQGQNANIVKIQELTTAYNTKSIALKELSKKLEYKYPILLDHQKTISISDLQKKIKEDNIVLIEYFYGNQNIYQFKIHHNHFEVSKIENSQNFKKTIRSYIDFFDNASKIKDNIKRFTKNSYEVLTALKIPTNTDKLIIIPDSFLNFIPFETLLTRPVDTYIFQDMPFLLTSTEVSYEISAKKYIRSTTKHNTNNSILGVFPVFEKTEIALPNSVYESESIQQYFKGDFLQNEQATYKNFLKKAEQHNIIHLSTHATPGSFLVPAAIKFRNQDIFVNQLYSSSLSAELVVLSACETGIGKLSKGEGPISISRGFQYAGIENVLFSLWKVNDKTTAQLMNSFYKNLNNSNLKAKSLHQAKLEYLNQKNLSNIQKSPYYWAAFVYYGSIEDQRHSSLYIWYCIGIIVFLLIVLFLHKFLQNKK
ncbi:CHAT domain-containing protein [Aquimarina aggregata]|uniref:CHAT domain-containing protein n=1 Tax=Aquimarina aggregata TaxID=1642818 RepID=UPI00249055A4|nr:CHAT domain-containing protein [Aquimarina aggregata]